MQNENNLPPVTVAVCVLNGQRTIKACLDSLMKLDYPRELITLMLVNNGSTDDTVTIAQEYPVQIIDEPVKGRGRARNRAMKECKTPFLAFTDADCTVTEDWLTTVMPVFDDPSVGAAGSDIVTPGDEILARFFEERQIVSNREFSGDYLYSPPFLATANCVFRLDAMEKVSGFRDFDIGEDADICWRISKAGYKLKYIPGGVVYHHHRTSIKNMFLQAVSYGHHGVHIATVHFPGMKCWVWWGLYARILFSGLRILTCPFQKTRYKKILPVLDFIRYSGLALGRIYAAFKYRKCIA